MSHFFTDRIGACLCKYVYICLTIHLKQIIMKRIIIALFIVLAGFITVQAQTLVTTQPLNKNIGN